MQGIKILPQGCACRAAADVLLLINMEGIKVNAVMLRSADYGENDKMLTLLTAELGKISAGIKGVKKAGAKLRFAAQPFCFAEYILSRRGERYTVTQASEVESFYELRTDISKFYAASAVCECANSLTYGGGDDIPVFTLTVQALSNICNFKPSPSLIRFLLSVLSVSGYTIGLENCSECGAPLTSREKMRFDMNTGAFTCWDCGDGYGTGGATYNVLRMCSGKSYQPQFISSDGEKRALRLLREYLVYKTDSKCSGLGEYIRLL